MSTKRKPQHRSPVPKPKYRYERDAARPALPPPPPPLDPTVAQMRSLLGNSLTSHMLSALLPHPDRDQEGEPQ